MKKNIALTIALAFLCATFTVRAQEREINYLPDSIRIEFPDQKAFVIFEMRNFKNNSQFIETFPARLQNLITHIEKALPSEPENIISKRIDVQIKPENEKLFVGSLAGNLYKPEGEKMEIILSDLPVQTHITIRKNTIEQLLPPGWELYINAKDIRVTIYANSFVDLKSLASQNFILAASALKADPKMEHAGRKRIQSRIIISQDKIVSQQINYLHPLDLIFITGHAGVGLLQDKIYPELSVSFGFYFKDRFNRRNHRLELIYNNMFFTKINIESFDLNINSFLSVGYSKNFSGTKNSQWTTIGAGLMIRGFENYFKGNTAKFFISTDIGNSKLNLVPEFYLTDNFSKFAFGLKLNYTF